jgi:hypothetical protein
VREHVEVSKLFPSVTGHPQQGQTLAAYSNGWVWRELENDRETSRFAESLIDEGIFVRGGGSWRAYLESNAPGPPPTTTFWPILLIPQSMEAGCCTRPRTCVLLL